MSKKNINGIKYILILNENAKTAEVIKKRGGYKDDVIIPDTIELKEVPYNVTSIGESAFEGCSSLSAITIPNSVTSIGESAFEGCSSLNAITIPASVTSIGVHAFKGCSSLTDINYRGTIEQWEKITLDDEWNKNVPAKVIRCTDDDVDILPNELQQNPMYRLSMSSLELFHSNFLEWLFDLDHKAFLTCFGFDVDSSTYTIEREYHLGTDNADKQWVTDIAVFKNGKMILIIENKIKSTPSKGQLKYQSKLAGEDCKKVLLSLFEYSVSEDKSYGFDKVLYKELCKKIRDNYKSYLRSNSYINDYCKMLERLQEVIDKDPLVKNWRIGYYTAHMFSKKLEIYDMMDAFRKYQAASLADKFEKLFIKTDPKTGMSLCKKIGLPMTCKHSLNNKRACATISYELIPGKLCVGVQVEQDQLRVFFENRDKNKEFYTREADAYWNAWLVNPLGTGKEGKAYCSYSDSFIYRYEKLESIITTNDLCNRVEELLNKIIYEYKYNRDTIFNVLK